MDDMGTMMYVVAPVQTLLHAFRVESILTHEPAGVVTVVADTQWPSR